VAGQPQNSSQQSSSTSEFQLVILSRPYCPSPPPPGSLTESRYENPTTKQAQTGRTHDTLGSGRGDGRAVLSLTHSLDCVLATHFDPNLA
jgi:hypothetical protein